MTLTVKFKIENAAFFLNDKCDDIHAAEVARILNDLAGKIAACETIVYEETWPLMDVNGNKVGEAVVR